MLGGRRKFQTPMAWTQGLRPPPTAAVATMPWQELLWRRLTGRLQDVPSGDSTLRAEAELGLKRSVYFYVGYCRPDFGELVVAFDNHNHDAASNTSVTPFDTGGLLNHIRLVSALSVAQRSDLVRRETYPVGDYQSRMSTWLRTAYASAARYVAGDRPSFGCVPQIDTKSCTDERAWTWEGRTAARDYRQAPLRPSCIYFRPGHLVKYLDWVMEAGLMEITEAKRHDTLVRRIAHEVDDPVSAMRGILSAGRR